MPETEGMEEGTTLATAGADAASRDAGPVEGAEDKLVEGAEDKPVEGAEGKPVEGAESKPAERVEGAPETYADFKLPEGVKIDEGLTSAALPVFKELNLTQEQAQRLIDIQAKGVQDAAQAHVDTWKETVDGWRMETKADKEIGGEKLAETLDFSKQAVEKVGTPGFKKFLDDYGIGNHPEVVRFLARVGRATADDKFHLGSPAGGDDNKTQAERMYGT